MKPFVNRVEELRRLNASKAGLIVVFGRRRIGKTKLVERWGSNRKYAYTQAIEGSEVVQLQQITSDLKGVLPEGINPRSWSELLAAFKLINKPKIVVLDEFPYLVRSQPSLPSLLQKWVDHDQPAGLQLVLLGSSQTMMHGLFLQSDSPLYDRADLVVHLHPMTYNHFCEACSYDPSSLESFLIFSMTGGVPRYWRYIDGLTDPLDVADALFFGKTPRLEDEPDRLLKDEEIFGQQAKAIFESIGRGAARPSEIAGRMGIHQTALSKPLNILIHSNLVRRVHPFGESARNSKRTLYVIDDYALRFWYQVYSPHRSRWHLYDRSMKSKLIGEHASKVLEDEYRKISPDAAPYWEGKNVEFDCVRYATKSLESLIVSEIKFRKLKDREKKSIEQDITGKFNRSALARKFGLSGVEVLAVDEVLTALSRT